MDITRRRRAFIGAGVTPWYEVGWAGGVGPVKSVVWMVCAGRSVFIGSIGAWDPAFGVAPGVVGTYGAAPLLMNGPLGLPGRSAVVLPAPAGVVVLPAPAGVVVLAAFICQVDGAWYCEPLDFASEPSPDASVLRHPVRARPTQNALTIPSTGFLPIGFPFPV